MTTDTAELTLLDTAPVREHPAPALQQHSGALAPNSPAAMMLAARAQGVSPEEIGQMMDLQERWERREAEKAYNAAFAAFKAEAVRVMKGRTVNDGPLKGRAYAELHDVVHAVTPALSKHGLSASWKLSRDEKDWLEVTCTLKHVGGHCESVSMGGSPDTGGAKNALQARASTKTYLERYTLKAICGVAEGGDDDDGLGGGDASEVVRGWIEYAVTRKGTPDFSAACKEARSALNQARDASGLKAFNAAVGAAV